MADKKKEKPSENEIRPICRLIKERRKKANMSMQKLADKVGVSGGTICRIESGEVKTIKSDLAAKLSKALNIPISEFYEGDDDAGGEVSIEDAIEGAMRISRHIATPVYEKIGCGTPAFWSEDWSGDYMMLDDDVKANDCVAVRTKGDSMEPYIYEGDIAIIRLQPTVENGEIAAVRMDDEGCLLKILYMEKEGLRLVSYNENYPDLVYTWADLTRQPVTVLGKLMEVRKFFNHGRPRKLNNGGRL